MILPGNVYRYANTGNDWDSDPEGTGTVLTVDFISGRLSYVWSTWSDRAPLDYGIDQWNKLRNLERRR